MPLLVLEVIMDSNQNPEREIVSMVEWLRVENAEPRILFSVKVEICSPVRTISPRGRTRK